MPNTKTQKKTPKNAKELFKPFLFPCNTDKTARVNKGHTWLYNKEQKKPLTRSTGSILCGMDCGQAGITVVDFDTYKTEFQESKEAKAFLEECKKKSQFKYQTPSGGWHIFFRGSIKSTAPFPGVEIKSIGGYVCLYKHPAQHGEYKDWDSFYNDLPEWDFKGWGKAQKEHREFGPGKNNTAIPQRAGKAGYHFDFDACKKDLRELLINNRNNPKELDKHIEDYTNKFKNSMTLSLLNKHPKETIDNMMSKAVANEIIQPITITESDITRPKAFIDNLLLDNDFNFVGGPTKLGKSRALLSTLTTELRKKKKKGLILSTENDKNTMLAPLLKSLDALKIFQVIEDNAIKYFPKNAQHGPEKAQVFIDRVMDILKANDVACFLIDPLPRFFDWNNEVTVTTFIDGLRLAGKETNTCIIGVRNDGKEKSYDDVHKTKGSSALADISRQIIRAIPCHRRSELGKKNPKHKSFVLLTERSGLFKEVAILFKMEIRKLQTKNKDEFDIAVPVQTHTLKENIDSVKYLCTRESGQTARQKIVEYMEKQNPKRATLEELRDYFEDTINESTMKNILSGKGFDSRNIGGVSYYFPITENAS